MKTAIVGFLLAGAIGGGAVVRAKIRAAEVISQASGTGAVARSQQSKNSDVVSVKDFGAKGDGDADDGPAIAAWIAAQGSATAHLVFPAGTYKTNSNLTFPNTITVEMRGASFSGTGTVTFSTDYFEQHHLREMDSAAATKALVELDHYSQVAGSYGLDIQNYADDGASPTPSTGAQIGIVIHQYSDGAPAMQIDNTRSQPFIRMKEASNSTNSNGTQGTGPFFDFWGYTTGSPSTNLEIASLTHQLVWKTYDNSRPFIFESQTTGPSLRLNQNNAGDSLDIFQVGAGNAINVSQTGGATAVSIVAGAGAAGFYPLSVSGQDYGPNFTTSTNSGSALTVQKNGTGGGTGMLLVNKGTQEGIKVTDGTNTTFSVAADGALTERSTKTKGTCTLNGGSPATCTATVISGATCVATAQGTTAAGAIPLAVSVSTTTLTVTAANGSTAVVNYICLG